jgi:hypothetical protein
MPPIATFHVMNGDAIEGPYTAGQLRILEEKGTISGDTQIARTGEAEWLPLEVWREVIHGAPTHRGAIPGGISKRAAVVGSETGAANGMVNAALILALIGIAVILAGVSMAGSAAWIGGVTILGVALVLWVIGASK